MSGMTDAEALRLIDVVMPWISESAQSDLCKARERFAAMIAERDALRTAVADYMQSEGCSCCRYYEAHEKHEARLAELLHVDPFEDGSGWDFAPYRSDREQEGKA